MHRKEVAQVCCKTVAVQMQRRFDTADRRLKYVSSVVLESGQQATSQHCLLADAHHLIGRLCCMRVIMHTYECIWHYHVL